MDTAEFDRPERRRHKLVVTRNTEYHVRDGRVIAVRKRDGSDWIMEHTALGATIQGRLAPDAAIPLPGEPGLGDRLYLVKGERSVITSSIVAIDRPPKEVVVTEYPRIAA